jgi:hypothetical protein
MRSFVLFFSGAFPIFPEQDAYVNLDGRRPGLKAAAGYPHRTGLLSAPYDKKLRSAPGLLERKKGK